MTAGTALVLGANGLMGTAIAERLARRSRRMLLAARDGDALETTRSRLAAEGVDVRVVALDATDDDDLGAMADGGAIVNVTSTAGIAGVPGMAAYVAAKHGVVGLTRAAALDAAPHGIRVNAVAPGPIESGQIMRQAAEVRVGVGEHVPLRRMGTADEVAAAVDWLVSPDAAYVTGAVIPIDGGKTAGGA